MVMSVLEPKGSGKLSEVIVNRIEELSNQCLDDLHVYTN